MKTTLTGILVFILVGCSSVERDNPSKSVPNNSKALFEEGIKAYSEKKYAEAEGKYADFQSQYPTHKWLPLIQYNQGLAQEAQEKYAVAAANYKKVVDYYQGSAVKEVAESLYRMALCYEYLADDASVIVVLLQLREILPRVYSSISPVEVNSRLATAYSRIGQYEEAKKYFADVESGVEKMKRAGGGERAMLWFPKTLYSMGKMGPIKAKGPEDFKNYIESVLKSQIWLLKAIESGDPVFSDLASVELDKTYKSLWKYIDTFRESSTSDELQNKKNTASAKKEMAKSFDKAIQALRVEKVPLVPGEVPTKSVKALNDLLAEMSGLVDGLIFSKDPQDNLTPEAEKRASAKKNLKLEKVDGEKNH